MKTKNTIEFKFLKAYNAEITRHQNDLDNFLERAGDKKFALSKHLKFFNDEYLNDQKAFPKLLPFLNEVENILKLDKDKTFYGVLENSREYREKGEDLIIFLGVFKAKYDFSDQLQYMFNNYDKNENETALETLLDPNFIFEWSSKLTQMDFAKIFYALTEAGFLNGEITKIIPNAAIVLNFEIGKQWKANISKGKNKTNYDFQQTKIFDDLKEAF